MNLSRRPTVVSHDVSKIFSTRSLNGRFLFRRGGGGDNGVTALRNVSLLAYEGESIGLLGQNGSGKSTLLRIIAGKERESSGQILVSSTPSLLGVAAALQPHLSGLENIELGCLAMGMTPNRLGDAVRDISEFCDIGDAIRRPLKTYSSGMAARLRFGISTSMRPEILLVDEALSTGDAAFNARAKGRMESLLSESGTVFVVSHVAKTIQSICSRSIWLHNGEIIADGKTEEVGELYDDWVRHRSEKKYEGADRLVERVRRDYMPIEIKFLAE